MKVEQIAGAAPGFVWVSPAEQPLRLSGFAWFAQDRVYRRMPVNPPAPLPASVDALANSTAGGQIQFQTDSPRLAVRVELLNPHTMDHMPATGQCGFDCYLGAPKAQRFCGVTRFPRGDVKYEHTFFAFPDSVMRNVTLNFPLYQGVKQVHVGFAPGSEVIAPPAYDDARPIVVYGTSITQGGCASRPGMAYTNILSRKLNRPFINLGFSGSGRGEREVAQCLGLIPDPALYVLDYEANAWGEPPIDKTLRPFIAVLREARPSTPILVVSKVRYAREAHYPDQLATRLQKMAFQKETVESLAAAGDGNIHFFDGSTLYGDDFDEVAVDGAHPTDLGFWLMAKGLAPVIRRILSA
ncbi:MAG TPA: SGNH/GDSL hydrolase family protein [Candidatus Brocadiia bacterium]|nr:SGNH/GDSL hydrolase family protein [Candidatus Brocadiia bacterium]